MAVNHELRYELPSDPMVFIFHDDQGSGNQGNGNSDDTGGTGGSKGDNGDNSGATGGQDSGGQTGNDDMQSLLKEVQGLRTLVGKQSNEVGTVRELKTELAELKKTISSNSAGTGDDNGQNDNDNSGSEQPPELSVADEQSLNERWKGLSAEDREKMIEEASGTSRREKIDNVRKEFAKIYATEAQPTPDELFPTQTEANQSGRNRRAGNTLQSLIREGLGLKEAEHRTGVPPGSRPSGGSRQTTQAGSQPQSRRGQTSGGLTGLGSNNK